MVCHCWAGLRRQTSMRRSSCMASFLAVLCVENWALDGFISMGSSDPGTAYRHTNTDTQTHRHTDTHTNKHTQTHTHTHRRTQAHALLLAFSFSFLFSFLVFFFLSPFSSSFPPLLLGRLSWLVSGPSPSRQAGVVVELCVVGCKGPPNRSRAFGALLLVRWAQT